MTSSGSKAASIAPQEENPLLNIHNFLVSNGKLGPQQGSSRAASTQAPPEENPLQMIYNNAVNNTNLYTVESCEAPRNM